MKGLQICIVREVQSGSQGGRGYRDMDLRRDRAFALHTPTLSKRWIETREVA